MVVLGCILDYFKVIPSKENEKLTCNLSGLFFLVLFHKKSKLNTLRAQRSMLMKLLTNQRQQKNNMATTVTVIRSNSWISLIRKLRKKVRLLIM